MEAKRPRVPFKRGPPVNSEECKAKKKLKFMASKTFLLPNGTSVKMELDREKLVDFDGLYEELERRSESKAGSREVDWRSSGLFVEDESGARVEELGQLFAGKTIFLVQDGGNNTVHKDQELWNVTPEPEMLERLPDGYNLETALADHVDNALQAVWENKEKCRRLVSVEISPDSITIFDTGHGMDASEENPIARWGTVGASSHRDVHHKGIGGQPPFLKPYLGKYGVGGVAAALHLGKHVQVRSKTEQSSKVVSLVLMKGEINQDRDQGGGVWRTHGGFHEMTEEELRKAPHGSFTSVKISGLNSDACIKDEKHYWKLKRVRQMLKDIYSLYIQCDGVGRTVTSVEFEVNGENLLEETGGEITTCNKHSCNGEPFVVDLKFQSGSDMAHGRLTCQYFPSIKGRETLDNVIEELKDKRSFQTFPRVGVRWLGRLLPSARWYSMPFMEAKLKGRDQRRWMKRVKIFADLDAGFQPTPTKTNLVESHHFTIALKQLGDTVTEPDVRVMIRCGDKDPSLSELSDQFRSWLKLMHEAFDQDVEFSGDMVYVINQGGLYNKMLGVEKEVLTFHKHLKDQNGDWKAGDRVKLQAKGIGWKKNFYGVIEWFFCDGTAEEHGEVKMVCRPVEVLSLDKDESEMTTTQGACTFELNKCKWFSVIHLSSDKCEKMNDAEWNKQLAVVQNKLPSHIEILSNEDRKHFNEPDLPKDGSTLPAGYKLPDVLLAVVRPRQGFGPMFKNGMIVSVDDLRLKLEVTVERPDCEESIITEISNSQSRGGSKGIYIFPTRIWGSLTRSGRCSLKVSQADDGYYEHLEPACLILNIKPLGVHRWQVGGPESIRLDEILEQPLLVEKLDKYENHIPFNRSFPVHIFIQAPPGKTVASMPFNEEDVKITEDNMALSLSDFVFPGFRLPPTCEALIFVVTDRQKLGHLKCVVHPGKLSSITMTHCSLECSSSPYMIMERLKPLDVIQRLSFQATDKYENVVRNQKLTLKLSGIEPMESERKVDETGLLNLAELRVANQFNSTGSIALHSEDDVKLVEVLFKVADRILVFAAEPPKNAYVGRTVDGLTVHVVDEDGKVDSEMDGTLSASWEDTVCFKIQQGVCHLSSIEMPRELGTWSGCIWHSSNSKIQMSFQINLEAGAPCSLIKSSDLVVFARCKEEFTVGFQAVDILGLPAVLSDEDIDAIGIQVSPEENLLSNLDILQSAHITVRDGSSYVQKVVLSGKQGCYSLSLTSPLPDSATNTWKVQLAPGCISRLVMVLPVEGSSISDELSRVLQDGPGFPSIQRRGLFPKLLVYLMDSNDNVCDTYDGDEVALKVPDQPSQRSKVEDGCTSFYPFTVDVQPGAYEMEAVLKSDQVQKATIQFEVEPGNFPSSLRVLERPPPEVLISDEDGQCVPAIKVLVESEDGLPLNSCPQVLLSILKQSGEAWVESYRGERQQSSLFLFRDVLVPTEAGNYVLKFFLCEHNDVTPILLQLNVLHGRPASLKFTEGTRESRKAVLVDVVDRNGNRCMQVKDLELAGQIEVVNSFKGKSLYVATARNGRAAFQEFELDPGIYSFRVSLCDDEIRLPEISAPISAVRGQHPQVVELVYQMLEQQSQEYQNLLRTMRQYQQRLQAMLPLSVELQKTLKSNREKLSTAERNSKIIAEEQRAAKDDQVLDVERRQPQLSELQIINMLSRDEDAAAAAICLARQEKPPPPNFPASEILGLAFTFARVETKQLNDVLSNYLGCHKLLTIVCKSARASSWIETLDSAGNIDKTKGLHAFAQRKNLRIDGLVPVMYLDELQSYKRKDGGDPVNNVHPQKLLRIDEPLLRGKGPVGFLGFAVNMLHLNTRQLQLQLRQKLFFHLFRKLQVYDTRKNMLNARAQQSSKSKFRAVSLDGASCYGFRVNHGKTREPRLCFATVAYSEREKSAVAQPAAAAFMRKLQQSKLIAERHELTQSISEDTGKLEENEVLSQEVKRRLKIMEERFLHCKAGHAPFIPPPADHRGLLAWQADDQQEDGGECTEIQVYVHPER